MTKCRNRERDTFFLHLSRQYLLPPAPQAPIDEWERRLFAAAVDCGVSVTDSALSSDGLYE
jgi:hypothetical protein